MHRTPLLLALLLVGCAETVSPVGTPIPAPRRAGAWQQFCEQASNVQHASLLVAARGAEGWELAAMYNGVLCFKRPMPEPYAAPRSPVPTGAPSAPLMRDPGF